MAYNPPEYQSVEWSTVLKNGRAVGRVPIDLVVASDRPERSFVESGRAICGEAIYKIAPDGSRLLCAPLSRDGLFLVDVARPKSRRLVVRDFGETENATGFAWDGNDRFIVAVYDKTCPYAQLYTYFPARIEQFDGAGHAVSTGPCAFGVVGGRHRIALLGEAPNTLLWHIRQDFADNPDYYNDGYADFHHTWSVDSGHTWHDGLALAFDGNDTLLYREDFGDGVYSERGQLAFRNVYSIQWSR